jgi:hypothetical protein
MANPALDPRFRFNNPVWDVAYGDSGLDEEAPAAPAFDTVPGYRGASDLAAALVSPQPSLQGTQEYQDFVNTGNQLRAALTPKPIGTARALLGAFVSARNPTLGSVITGDFQRQRRIQPLMQQYNLLAGLINQNRELQNQDILNRLHSAQADYFSQRPTIDLTKVGLGNQQKRNQIESTLRSKGLEGVWDDNNNLIDTKPLTGNMVPGAKKYIPDLDPQTRKPFYHVLNQFGQEVGRVDVNAISSMMSKTSSTTEYKQDEDGNIIALPKTTTTSPVIGGTGSPAPSGKGGQAPTAPAGPRIVAKGKVPNMSVGSLPDGTQVAGTPEELRSAGATGVTSLPSSESAKVVVARQLTSPGGLFDLAQKDLAQFKPGELEALSPRWNEFLAGKIGTADPRYVALRTHVNGLLATALMQAHVGSRGGEQLMEHFEDLANTGKMSKDTLAAALNAEQQYVNEKAMRPPKKGAGTVQMKTPDGRTWNVPADKVEAAKSRGAQVVE